MAAINTLSKAVIYSTILDEVIRAGLTSAPLEAGSSNVKYTSGDSCKIAKITVGGYGKYDRGTTGYPQGAVTQEWETKTITQDRGVKFSLDIMDEDETANVLSATNVISQFAQTQSIPELDSYRYSTIFQAIVNDTTVIYGYYTPVVATILTTLQQEISAIRIKVGRTVPLVIFMSETAFGIFTTSTELSKQIMTQNITGDNGITTEIFKINGIQVIPVPTDRMKTQFIFSDTNSFSVAGWAQTINWIIMAPSAAVAFVKHQKTRVISADQNQSADAELVLARTVHDVWVYDNKHDSMFISLTATTITDIGATMLAAGSGKVTYTLGTAYTNRLSGTEFYYKNTASAAALTAPAVYDAVTLGTYTKITTASATDVTVTATHKMILVHVDANGRALEWGYAAAGA